MMYHTKGRDLEQQYLLPVNIKEWLPEDDFRGCCITPADPFKIKRKYFTGVRTTNG